MLIFISYSRNKTDSTFVDRLEAELQAREINTWVDRRKLVSGNDGHWLDQIERAIDVCDALLVVLTPDAAVSRYVKMEYRYADTQGKAVIPLLRKDCPKVPIDLNGRQWINYQNNNRHQGLQELLSTLSSLDVARQLALPTSPSPPIPMPASMAELDKQDDSGLADPRPAEPTPAPPSPDLMTLYRAGRDALNNNQKEHGLFLWEQIYARDPNFMNGTFLSELKQLRKKLYPMRIQRLYEHARQARLVGEWGQEIGALKVIQELRPSARDVKERMDIAETNLRYAWQYELAQERVRENNLPAARSQLQTLWKYAPYYGDPAKLAGYLNINVPRSYDVVIRARGNLLLAAYAVLLPLVVFFVVNRMQVWGMLVVWGFSLFSIAVFIVLFLYIRSLIKLYS